MKTTPTTEGAGCTAHLNSAPLPPYTSRVVSPTMHPVCISRAAGCSPDTAALLQPLCSVLKIHTSCMGPWYPAPPYMICRIRSNSKGGTSACCSHLQTLALQTGSRTDGG